MRDRECAVCVLGREGRWGSPGEETARETAKVVYRQWC